VTRGPGRQAGVPSVRCSHTVPLKDGSGGRRRCKKWARPGTTVCEMHVGKAAHVLRKADERMTLAQVIQHDARPLGEVLLDATHVADSLMRDLKTQVLAGGEPVDPDLLTRLVEATRLAHHLAETSVRAGVQVELVRQARLSSDLNADAVVRVLARVLDALTAGPRAPLAPLGHEYLAELRAWLHEVVGLELEALEACTDADPDGGELVTSRPVTHPPSPALPGALPSPAARD
jgi:hypothetical protein